MAMAGLRRSLLSFLPYIHESVPLAPGSMMVVINGREGRRRGGEIGEAGEGE
jgi:hypothetical protein